MHPGKQEDVSRGMCSLAEGWGCGEDPHLLQGVETLRGQRKMHLVEWVAMGCEEPSVPILPAPLAFPLLASRFLWLPSGCCRLLYVNIL